MKNCGKSASELYPEDLEAGLFGVRVAVCLRERERLMKDPTPSRRCGVLLIIYAIAGSNLGAFNEVAERFIFLCCA